VFWLNTQRRPVTGYEAVTYGLDVTPIDSRKYVGTAPAAELWLEAPLERGWRVAYRLALEGTRPVVAEMRVLPRAPGMVALWSGYIPGTPLRFPKGGITARLLRTVTLGDHVATLDEIIKANPAAFEPGGPFQLAGLTPKPSHRPKSTRGRPSLGDKFYAELAAAYVAACRRHLNPVARVAAARRSSVDVVKSQVARARRLGYLTPGKPGLPGGKLTTLAANVLGRKLTES